LTLVLLGSECRDGLHDFSNPTDEPARLLGISTKRFPDVVAYPERGVAWVATHHPGRPRREGDDKGVIARFELPPETREVSHGDTGDKPTLGAGSAGGSCNPGFTVMMTGAAGIEPENPCVPGARVP
jgi:hypothetical protein